MVEIQPTHILKIWKTVEGFCVKIRYFISFSAEDLQFTQINSRSAEVHMGAPYDPSSLLSSRYN